MCRKLLLRSGQSVDSSRRVGFSTYTFKFLGPDEFARSLAQRADGASSLDGEIELIFRGEGPEVQSEGRGQDAAPGDPPLCRVTIRPLEQRRTSGGKGTEYRLPKCGTVFSNHDYFPRRCNA